MEKVIVGKILKVGNNVDTDAIIPAKYLVTTDMKELGKHALEGLDPISPSKLKDRPIIIAGRNFGCGSSREHAVLALLGAGVKAVIAESFARIFYRNAINRGLLVIEVPGISSLVFDDDTITIDLYNNKIALHTTRQIICIKPLPEEILELLELGGLLEKLRVMFKGREP
ncbi:MAG: 3-isopropylmalate dehydratase [Sulfolobales archaeon]